MQSILLKIQMISYAISTGIFLSLVTHVAFFLLFKTKADETFLQGKDRFEFVPPWGRGKVLEKTCTTGWVVALPTEMRKDRKDPGLWEERSRALFWTFRV